MKNRFRSKNFWKQVAIAATFCVIVGVGSVFVDRQVSSLLVGRYSQSTIDLINAIAYLVINLPAIFWVSKYIERFEKADD